MKFAYRFTAITLLIASLTCPALMAQSQGLARSGSFADDADRMSEARSEQVSLKNAASPAQQFLNTARKLMGEGNYVQAKEALKTAIRFEPMNPEAWLLYDEAAIGNYIANQRAQKLNPVIERDIKPLFEISRVDSYIERDTLYVVGSLKNLSDQMKREIQITAKILNKNKKELRRQTGELSLTPQGLLPNESSLFEIPFKNPPGDAKVFKLEVSNFE